MGDIWFPPFVDYVMSRRCSTCGAVAWTDCTARRKRRSAEIQNENRARFGQPPTTPNRADLQHVTRQDAGAAHRSRDIGRAPWTEDRVPGTNYGTVRYPGGAR